jgi:PAS domain S-box-containing protein
MKQIIDNLTDVAWVGEAGGRIEYVSPAIQEVTGYFSRDVLLGGMECLFARMRRCDVPRHREAFAKACRGQESWEADVRFRRADDRWIWLQVRASRPRGESGAGIIYGTFSDVTPRKSIERELRAATRAAKAAERANSMFLANISHELRTPMTGIIGYTELLLAGEGKTESERARWTQLIDGSSRRLLALLNEILDQARLESGVVDQTIEACNLREVVDSEIALLTPLAAAKGLKLEVTECPTVPTIAPTCAMRVRQVVTNLVGNAVKFTDRGDVKVHLRASRSAAGGAIHVDVSDTGPGVNPSDEQRIFEPFRRGQWQQGNRPAGTGLGLSISRRIARAMGGDVQLTHSSRAGSTFTLSIPVPSLLPRTGALQRPHGRENRPVLPSGSVFIVDDCAIASELATRYLGAANIMTRASADAAEAIEVILEAASTGEPFDVVLMDMTMPGLDGFKATAQLRAAGYHHPIIAFTAGLMADERRACLEAGCDDIVGKPIMRDVLLAAIAKATRPAQRQAA